MYSLANPKFVNANWLFFHLAALKSSALGDALDGFWRRGNVHSLFFCYFEYPSFSSNPQ